MFALLQFSVYSSCIDPVQRQLLVEIQEADNIVKVQTISMQSGQQIGAAVVLDQEPNTPVVEGLATLSDKAGKRHWVGTRFAGGCVTTLPVASTNKATPSAFVA